MQTGAKLRHLRISPRKVRLVIDSIRGLSVERALEQLKFSSKHAALPIIKLINSAVANAEHNDNLEKSNLFIKEIHVDEGPILKRWRARAFGRAAGIGKRTSHVSLVLAELKPTVKKKDKKDKQKSEIKKAKVVNSLDEVSFGRKGELAGDADKGDIKGEKEDKIDKLQVEKTKGPKSTKRRFFSRKSG